MLIYFTNSVLIEADFKPVNIILSHYPISIIVTIIGFTAIANAWNFIDGVNGLASGIAITSCLGLTYFSLNVGLYKIVEIHQMEII